MNNGVDFLNISIDDLFKDDENSQTQDETSTDGQEPNLTQNMINRINSVKQATEKETQDKIAKELGFESYDAMKKSQNEKLFRESGFDPKDVEQIIEPLLKQRLESDPRFKKLEEYEQRERDRYVKEKIASINALTGQNLTVATLPKETLELWAKGIDLEQAYFATHGRDIIVSKVSQADTGSLAHLAPAGGATSVKTRKLTAEEKEMWRAIVPGITEEELSKKTTKI